MSAVIAQLAALQGDCAVRESNKSAMIGLYASLPGKAFVINYFKLHFMNSFFVPQVGHTSVAVPRAQCTLETVPTCHNCIAGEAKNCLDFLLFSTLDVGFNGLA